MSSTRVKQRLQATLKARGYGLISLLNSFREFDINGDGELSWEEFNSALLKCGLTPAPQDMRALFLELDTDGSNSISYNEFVKSMRGELSAKRRAIISQVFNSIDTDGDGVVSMTDIGACLNPKNHPDVRAGRTTVQKLLTTFFDSFATVSSTGTLTLPQFMEYYANMAAYDEENDFENVMKSMWNIKAGAGATKKGATSLQAFAAESAASQGPGDLADVPGLESLRNQLISRGSKGFIGLQRKFRIMDDDGSKSLNLAEFKKGMRESSVILNDIEINALFNYFDQDKSGTVDFEEFIHGVRGPLNARRRSIVEQAFRSLDKKNSGVVTPEDIMSVYDASKHPDVIAGKRTQQDILREFLETFDVGGEVDGKVTRQEFINYYSNIGASIDDDDYFELMVRNAWHISGGTGWAANSANRRVLVTRDDGSQYVEEIKDDLGLKANDKAGMMNRLKAQGVNASNISLFDGMESDSGGKGRRGGAGAAGAGAGASAGAGAGPARGGKALGAVVSATASKASSSNDQLEASIARAGPDAGGPTTIAPPSNLPAGVGHIVTKLKAELKQRGFGGGFISLQRKFRIMDDDNSKSLSMAEFKKAMKEMNMNLTDVETRKLFDHFDTDHSGTIDFEEFIQGVRDPLNERRLRLVQMAFTRLDKDGSGEVDAEEIATMYDASKHPEVISGRKTPKEVLTQFLSTFDVGGEVDGKVTQQEFINYYTNLGANIDNDDYFELMIRNAWHISGGEGWCANSSNRRVLVTRADGSQYVEEIKDDLGLKADDKAGMIARLKAQGVDAANISLFDGGDDNEGAGGGANKPKPLEKVFKEKKVASASKGATVESANQLRAAEVAPEVAVARLGPRLDAASSAGVVIARPSTAPSMSVSNLPPPGLQMIIQKLKSEMKSRGAHGFVGLQRKFRIMDDDGSKTLDMGEFKKAMKETNMNLNDQELRMLFNYFDSDHSGTIDFEEFIQGVRDPLNERRLRLVNMAFTKLDKDGSGDVDVQEVATMYDASKHPDVLAGKKTPEQVFREFLDTFDVGGEKDGKVTLQEFINYYNNLSASIDNDDYFELMIRNAWHISGGEGWCANSSNKRVLVTRPDGSQYVEEIKDDLGLKAGDKEGMMNRLKAQGVFASSLDTNGLVKEEQAAPVRGKRFSSELGRSTVPSGVLPGSVGTGPSPIVNVKAKAPPPPVPSMGLQTIIQKLKTEIGTRGGRGYIGLQRKFRIMDDDGSKSLDMGEFKKAMKEMNMGLSDTELRMLFEHFDTDHSGTIDFEEFIQGVRDPLDERRLRLVTAAFNVIDKDGNGHVDVKEVATMYDASKHPEVIAGRMTPEQVFREFLDTFDVGGEKDGCVTLQEFINYYTNLGASIDNDDYFELMIRNAWHMSGGEGWSANTANRRVLVTRADGSQYVEEIKNDLGLKADDKAGMIARLKAQGVDVTSISLFDGGDDNSKPGVAAGGRPKSFSDLTTDRPSRKHAPTSPSRGVAIGENSANNNSRARQAPPPPPPTSGRKGNQQKEADHGLQLIIQKLKTEMKQRGANGGFIALQRKFRIMDDDGSKSLNMGEFKKAMKEMNMGLSDAELRMLFDHFDADHSGSIDFEEFIQGVRDPLDERRLALVNLAFDAIDDDKSGVVEANELLDKYDASKHPDVIAGKKTAKQVLSEWMSTFEVGGDVDGCVTRQEFVNYYTNIGANIDNDDYFELMIRNAWHLSGGEGWSANTANRRVLVTRPDGSQYVEEIKHDLGLKADDKAGMMARLKAQGVNAANISLFDGAEDNDKGGPKSLSALANEQRTGGGGKRATAGARPSTAPPPPTSNIITNNVGPTPPTPPASARTSIRPADTMGSTLSTRPSTAGASVGPKQPNTLSAPISTVPAGVALIVTKLKGEMKQRGGGGFIALQRKFRIMDDDGSKSLDMGEFKKAMKEMNMGLSDAELRMLFEHFDSDHSGSINFEEFIQGVRDPLDERRARLVNTAFDMLDEDHSGVIEANELLSKYDATKHPDVIAGKKTAQQVLTEWMSTFDVGGEVDGCVTRQEFLNYYTNIGANIDNDDYFELMIRNAWHISGGEGWSANTANRRVLSTRADGSQYVEEIKNDLGLKAGDKAGMMARLKAQGSQASSISLFGGGVDGVQEGYQPGQGGGFPAAGASSANAGAGRARVPSGSRMHQSNVVFGDDSKPAPAPQGRPSTSAGSTGSAQRSKAQSLASKVTSAGRTLEDILADMKDHFAQRGVRGIVALQRRFRIMDDDNSGSINMQEFKKAMRECSINLSDEDCRLLFSFFDTDGSGELNFEEFVQGCKGPMSQRRINLVNQAFSILDKHNTGEVHPEDIMDVYDATKHPDVLAGKRTAKDVLQEFLDTFDVGGEVDGKVTRQEFLNYYSNVGATIDDDDYFELMIRNAWHISGGTGWSANTANRRVLVTRADGSQSVEEIKNDLGLKADDRSGMMARLKAQGVDASNISLFDGGDDGVGGKATPARRNNPIVGDPSPTKPSKKVGPAFKSSIQFG